MQILDYLESTGILQQDMAAELGITPSGFGHYIHGRRPWPPEVVLKLVVLTDGYVTPHELLPHVYPNPSDGLPPRKRAA